MGGAKTEFLALEYAKGDKLYVPVHALALSLASEFLARAATESPDRFRSLALVTPTGFTADADRLREAEGSNREVLVPVPGGLGGEFNIESNADYASLPAHLNQYAGQLGVTSSSGPGIALKTEAIGLGIMTELPLVIVNSQRGGPSTGLPTKTEQSDLYQAVYGRNGDAPMPVIAACSPSDAFEVAIEACRIATQYMTPVMLLTDGYIANAAEPWKVPDPAAYEPFPVSFMDSLPEAAVIPGTISQAVAALGLLCLVGLVVDGGAKVRAVQRADRLAAHGEYLAVGGLDRRGRPGADPGCVVHLVHHRGAQRPALPPPAGSPHSGRPRRPPPTPLPHSRPWWI